jgi:hypothetical protein
MVTTVDDRRETASLIGSDKADGPAVYGADNQRIGSVQRVMIDKISGKIAYAVVSFGGFMGMGEDYFPMPWANLKLDTQLGRLSHQRRRIGSRVLRSSRDLRIGTGATAPTIVGCMTTIRLRSGTDQIDSNFCSALTLRGAFCIKCALTLAPRLTGGPAHQVGGSAHQIIGMR